MDRNEILEFMKDVYTSSEDVEYLNISTQRLNQVGQFDINTPYVRDAILYYTIQQYFNNNDKKTCEFIG